MRLPDAEHQPPACGACGGDTYYQDGFVCEDCQLFFDRDSLAAEFIEPRAKVCGAACDNTWHGDHKIKPGRGFNCGTCELPDSHTSMHWFSCQPVTIAEVSR